MADTPANDTVSGTGTSDEALTAATGRPWSEWFDLLDAAGAEAWPHARIARWLHEEQGVPGWWSQAVTVGFEQARGLRMPGQRADGSFEVSTSRTFPLDQQAALDAVVAAVTAGLGQAPTSQGRTARYPTARWKLAEGGSLLATAALTKAGRTSVSLTRGGLADAAALGPAKAAMAGWLGVASSGPAHGLD